MFTIGQLIRGPFYCPSCDRNVLAVVFQGEGRVNAWMCEDCDELQKGG